ncbi:hypothetical protein FNV43_RR04266 [Rhamnella rubrinervis]|uniref:MBD domain-containing protein n=1 Tax=Rhamnella rubrinervis TaxID=2594499 RepID=A0A8K0HLF2_9ROSA|nr:hypothetical protein FNV43_RR04266 [Rhamnella rubrinervis]
MSGDSSRSTPVHLLLMSPDEKAEEPDYSNRELMNVTSTSPFRLPDDWSVVVKPRGTSAISSGRVDKYYYEPGTGQMFRSLIAVQKYLREGKRDTPTATTKKLRAVDKFSMQIMPYTISRTSTFTLPDGWIIEGKRRTNKNYSGIIDKYYIEPGTGQRFRSLRAVERYLSEASEDAMPLKALKHAHKLNVSLRSCPQKKNVSLKVANEYPTEAKEFTSKVKTVKPFDHSRPLKHSGKGDRVSVADFSCRPSKINWVLAGPGGNMWSPFMGESMVPESVKQKWSETFISSIHEGSLNPPGF